MTSLWFYLSVSKTFSYCMFLQNVRFQVTKSREYICPHTSNSSIKVMDTITWEMSLGYDKHLDTFTMPQSSLVILRVILMASASEKQWSEKLWTITQL